MLAPEFVVGLGDWNTPEWVGPFYPEKSKPDLSYVARYFPAVELDNTYYRRPGETQLKALHKAVPDDFRFALKMFRGLLPTKPWGKVEEQVIDFFDRMRHLGEKWRWVLIQLAPFVSDKRHGDHVRSFLDGFETTDIPLHKVAFEFRHKDWSENTQLQRRFADLGMAWAWSEHPAAPGSPEVGETGYLRLLGDRDQFETFDSIQTDRTENITSWIQRFEETGFERAYIWPKNTYAGFAPDTANHVRRLADMETINWAAGQAKQTGLFDFG